jgi:hypothetical protein
MRQGLRTVGSVNVLCRLAAMAEKYADCMNLGSAVEEVFLKK